MMNYSPINWRRMDWFAYNKVFGSWRDLNSPKDLDCEQRSLTIQAYRGYLK